MQNSDVLLDQLLANVTIQVEPFAICLVNTGWRLNLPGPPEVLLHFVLEGQGTLRNSRDEAFAIGPSWLAVIPRNVKHSLECGPEISSLVQIDAAMLPEGQVHVFTAGPGDSPDLQVACGLINVTYGDSLSLFHHLDEVLVADLSAYPQARTAFESLLAEQRSPSAGSGPLTQALMSQCLVYLMRHLSAQEDQPLTWLSALQDPTLAPALDAMLNRPEAPHTVASLADTSAMSRTVFAERFNAAFGSGPMHFLHDLRLRRAAHILHQANDYSLDQIARRVGFTSRSHFSQAFKEHFRISPAAFRKARIV